MCTNIKLNNDGWDKVPKRFTVTFSQYEPYVCLEIVLTNPTIYVAGNEYELVINPVGEDIHAKDY